MNLRSSIYHDLFWPYQILERSSLPEQKGSIQILWTGTKFSSNPLCPGKKAASKFGGPVPNSRTKFSRDLLCPSKKAGSKSSSDLLSLCKKRPGRSSDPKKIDRRSKPFYRFLWVKSARAARDEEERKASGYEQWRVVSPLYLRLVMCLGMDSTLTYFLARKSLFCGIQKML